MALPPFLGGRARGGTGKTRLNDCAFAGKPRSAQKRLVVERSSDKTAKPSEDG